MSDENQSPERAIALEYGDAKELPKVLLSGAGELARKIVRLAQENDIPVQRDEALVGMLSGLPAGSHINEESFELVAEVLSFLYVTDEQWRENHKHLDELLPGVAEDSLTIE